MNHHIELVGLYRYNVDQFDAPSRLTMTHFTRALNEMALLLAHESVRKAVQEDMMKVIATFRGGAYFLNDAE